MNHAWIFQALSSSFLLGVSVFAGLGASAQDLGDIESNVARLQSEAAALNVGFGEGASLSRDLDLADRVSQAQVRMFLDQYSEAATILMEVVENRAFQSLPGWPQARYLLAEAFYLSRNFTMARGYYEDIIEAQDTHYSARAAGRVLEIALALNQYDQLDALYAGLQRAGSSSSPELAYVRGKALYFQGRDNDAFTALGNVAAGHVLYDRAQYFVGVLQTRAEQYDVALATFSAIAERLRDSADEDERDIRDLATLAVGRVYYELQDFAQAELWYGRVPADSRRADVATYELAWTQIQRENIRQALQTLSMLEFVTQDERFLPESQLLRADLWMQIENYDSAVQIFERIAGEFEAADNELRSVVEGRATTTDFFALLFDTETASLRLPEEARPWFRSNPDMERAMNLVQDRRTARADIEESWQVIRELDTVLNGETTVGLFPEFREAWGHGVDVTTRTVDERRRLVELEAAQVPGAITSGEYQQARSARLDVERQFLQTPRSFDAISQRSTQMVEQLQDEEFDVFRTQQELEGFLDEIAAMRRILQRQVSRGERTAGQARTQAAELAELESEFRTQLSETEEIIEAVRLRQLRAQTGPGLTDSDQAVRSRYLEALARERSVLRSMRGGANLGRIDALHGQLDSVDATIQGFFTSLESRVAELTSEARTVIAEERIALTRYEQALDASESQTNLLAGEIAYAAYVDVQESFSNLTLRANLGILDVAWRQKEALSDRIDELFEERDREYQILDADFAEIRESSP
jgi:predicted negative regulator of RcsB-dependent stress response